jgi:hypothetical protein
LIKGDDLMVRIEMYDELMLVTNGLFNASEIENEHTSFVDDEA